MPWVGSSWHAIRAIVVVVVLVVALPSSSLYYYLTATRTEANKSLVKRLSPFTISLHDVTPLSVESYHHILAHGVECVESSHGGRDSDKLSHRRTSSAMHALGSPSAVLVWGWS